MEYPKPYKTEDWIKCELYRILTAKGFECYPEMRVEVNKLHTYRKGAVRNLVVRADLVIYKDEKFICLIEVKNHAHDSPRTDGRQYKRYEATELPFIYCMNENQIDQTIEDVTEQWYLTN